MGTPEQRTEDLISVLRCLLPVANPSILSSPQEQLDELFWWATVVLVEGIQYFAQRL
jgi:hypothetical protein